MSGAEQKELPPTAHKLRQARKRGEVSRSRELVTACVTLVAVGMLFWRLPQMGGHLDEVLGSVAALEGQPFWMALAFLGSRLLWAGADVLGPFLVCVTAAALLSGIASTGGLVLSMHPVIPKLERIDPVKGFGRLFTLRSLVELAKSLGKLALVCAVAALVLRQAVPALVQLPGCGLTCSGGLMRALLQPLLVSCCLVFLVLALLDVGLQRWLFRRDQRMTRSEHKRDRRDGEGNPELRQRRKRDRDEDARFGARNGLRHATFVIEGREAALAFRYVPAETRVPIVVAFGKAETARQLVMIARGYGIPIGYDRTVEDAFFGKVAIGRMVPKRTFGPLIDAMRRLGVIG